LYIKQKPNTNPNPIDSGVNSSVALGGWIDAKEKVSWGTEVLCTFSYKIIGAAGKDYRIGTARCATSASAE